MRQVLSDYNTEGIVMPTPALPDAPPQRTPFPTMHLAQAHNLLTSDWAQVKVLHSMFKMTYIHTDDLWLIFTQPCIFTSNSVLD